MKGSTASSRIHLQRARLTISVLALANLTLATLIFPAGARAHDQETDDEPDIAPAAEQVPCIEGRSGDYPCFNIDLVHFLPVAAFGSSRTNDIWGWTDPLTGFEYAILGLQNGTAFLRIEADGFPRYLGKLPTRSQNSIWRDIKVYADHAFIVSEANFHGMQVFDLTRLRDLDPADTPVTFASDADYVRFADAHNIVINEETGFAYAVGTRTCNGGLHMIDIRDPLQPVFAGCFKDDGYTHDAQCVIYRGPDQNYVGREICFNSNEDTLTIVDVTDKDAPVLLSRASYFARGYLHQGWLTEDHAYFLLDDELDEQRFDFGTRTLVWDTSDLRAPFLAGSHFSDSPSIDHNLYVRGNHVFQANYRSGVRILRLGDLSIGEMAEVAYFDTTPADDLPLFSGTWSVYPYFESGYIVASDIARGLYVLRPDLAAVPECSDGIDNDLDGARDFPEDTSCIDEQAASEEVRFDVEVKIAKRFASRPIVLHHHRYRHHHRTHKLKLAVLGSQTVDVLDLDLDSLLFHPGDVVPRVRTRRGVPRTRDVNRDGRRDLVLRIALDQSTLAPGDERVCITGLISGDAFESCAEVAVVEHSWPRWRERLSRLRKFLSRRH
jgi:choice-of-anchor B domain-containing protein